MVPTIYGPISHPKRRIDQDDSNPNSNRQYNSHGNGLEENSSLWSIHQTSLTNLPSQHNSNQNGSISFNKSKNEKSLFGTRALSGQTSIWSSPSGGSPSLTGLNGTTDQVWQSPPVDLGSDIVSGLPGLNALRDRDTSPFNSEGNSPLTLSGNNSRRASLPGSHGFNYGAMNEILSQNSTPTNENGTGKYPLQRGGASVIGGNIEVINLNIEDAHLNMCNNDHMRSLTKIRAKQQQLKDNYLHNSPLPLYSSTSQSSSYKQRQIPISSSFSHSQPHSQSHTPNQASSPGSPGQASLARVNWNNPNIPPSNPIRLPAKPAIPTVPSSTHTYPPQNFPPNNLSNSNVSHTYPSQNKSTNANQATAFHLNRDAKKDNHIRNFGGDSSLGGGKIMVNNIANVQNVQSYSHSHHVHQQHNGANIVHAYNYHSSTPNPNIPHQRYGSRFHMKPSPGPSSSSPNNPNQPNHQSLNNSNTNVRYVKPSHGLSSSSPNNPNNPANYMYHHANSSHASSNPMVDNLHNSSPNNNPNLSYIPSNSNNPYNPNPPNPIHGHMMAYYPIHHPNNLNQLTSSLLHQHGSPIDATKLEQPMNVNIAAGPNKNQTQDVGTAATRQLKMDDVLDNPSSVNIQDLLAFLLSHEQKLIPPVLQILTTLIPHSNQSNHVLKHQLSQVVWLINLFSPIRHGLAMLILHPEIFSNVLEPCIMFLPKQYVLLIFEAIIPQLRRLCTQPHGVRVIRALCEARPQARRWLCSSLTNCVMHLVAHEHGHVVINHLLNICERDQTQFIEKTFISQTCFEKLRSSIWATKVLEVLLARRTKAVGGKIMLAISQFIPKLLLSEVGVGYMLILLKNGAASVVRRILRSFKGQLANLLSSTTGTDLLLHAVSATSLSRQREVIGDILLEVELLTGIHDPTHPNYIAVSNTKDAIAGFIENDIADEPKAPPRNEISKANLKNSNCDDLKNSNADDAKAAPKLNRLSGQSNHTSLQWDILMFAPGCTVIEACLSGCSCQQALRFELCINVMPILNNSGLHQAIRAKFDKALEANPVQRSITMQNLRAQSPYLLHHSSQDANNKDNPIEEKDVKLKQLINE